MSHMNSTVTFFFPWHLNKKTRKRGTTQTISATNLEIYYIPECFKLPNIKLLKWPSQKTHELSMIFTSYPGHTLKTHYTHM